MPFRADEGGERRKERTSSAARATLEIGRPLPAHPTLAGHVLPDRGEEGSCVECRTPIVAICFYRALVQSGETKPVEALIEALAAEGMRPLPVFVYSLKDAVSIGILESVFGEAPPDVVINTTGFAVSAPGADRQPTVLESNERRRSAGDLLRLPPGRPGKPRPQGLSARDLGMNVALPEVDGRVLSRAVSFKAAARLRRARRGQYRRQRAGCRPYALYRARLAANWARLRRTAPQTAAIALVMANYPNRDGRLGNGVGLDTPAGTIEVLKAMRAAGYRDCRYSRRRRCTDPASDGWPDQFGPGRQGDPRDAFPQSNTMTSSRLFRFRFRDEVAARWGDPETDPYFPRWRLRPAFHPFRQTSWSASSRRAATISIRRKAIIRRTSCRRMAISPSMPSCGRSSAPMPSIHMGKHGNLEWLPGKALALSENLLSRGDPRPAAASLSLHRQRSGRGHAGQAPHERRHHRSPDAAADAGRKLWPAEGPGGAGRRILRGLRRRPAAHPAAQQADPRSRRRYRPRPGCRHCRKARARTRR